MVDDVVTFPGRMYAFVNYRSLEEAVAAYDALQGQVVSGPGRSLVGALKGAGSSLHLAGARLLQLLSWLGWHIAYSTDAYLAARFGLAAPLPR